jgi:hypothetical protein
MYCKYCKNNLHNIDTCVQIKCLICNTKGHPHWKCPQNKINLMYKNKNKHKNPKKQFLIKYNKINYISDDFPFFNLKNEHLSWSSLSD